MTDERYVVVCTGVNPRHWQRCEMATIGGFHPVTRELAQRCADQHGCEMRKAVVVEYGAEAATIALLNRSEA